MKLAKDMFTMSVLVGREGDAIPDSFCKLQRRCTQSGERTEKYVLAFTCQVGPIRRVLNEPRREETGFSHMQKQRRRSASLPGS